MARLTFFGIIVGKFSGLNVHGHDFIAASLTSSTKEKQLVEFSS